MNSKPRRVRRGPRRGGDSRADILTAARALFAAQGFRATTTRQVAERAGVDVSLIHHYFGTKSALFQSAVDLPRLAGEVVTRISGPPGEAAERVARLYLERFFVEEGPTLSAMLRTALGSPGDVPQLRRLVEATMVTAATAALRGPDAALRAELVAAQMVGIFVLRHIIEVAPLAAATNDEVLRYLVPALSTIFATHEEPAA